MRCHKDPKIKLGCCGLCERFLNLSATKLTRVAAHLNRSCWLIDGTSCCFCQRCCSLSVCVCSSMFWLKSNYPHVGLHHVGTRLRSLWNQVQSLCARRIQSNIVFVSSSLTCCVSVMCVGLRPALFSLLIDPYNISNTMNKAAWMMHGWASGTETADQCSDSKKSFLI